MVHLMAAAFFTARAADFSADPTDFLREFRTARHEAGGHRADPGAIAIQPNAARHHFDIILLQTGAGAVFAFRGAIVAGFDTAFIFLVHNISFSCWFCGFGFT
jgi:hypothetical protein